MGFLNATNLGLLEDYLLAEEMHQRQRKKKRIDKAEAKKAQRLDANLPKTQPEGVRQLPDSSKGAIPI